MSSEKQASQQNIEKVLIIGSGPAGLTAAIYASRALLKPLMIEGEEAGGQLMITTDVENYPGFPKGVEGPEMMAQFRAQAERFGTRFITRNVTKVDFSQRPFKVWIGNDLHLAKTVIISTGASAKWLGLPDEKKWYNKGFSACATCDGAFFKSFAAVKDKNEGLSLFRDNCGFRDGKNFLVAARVNRHFDKHSVAQTI